MHDLRHGAASLPHCVGVDLKTVQAQLGHSSIVLTADTYTSVLTDLLAYAAEATAELVLAAAARKPGRQHRRRNDHPAESAAPAETGRSKRHATRQSDRRTARKGGRPPTSHKDQGRIARWLYDLMKTVRREGLDPRIKSTGDGPYQGCRSRMDHSQTTRAATCRPHVDVRRTR